MGKVRRTHKSLAKILICCITIVCFVIIAKSFNTHENTKDELANKPVPIQTFHISNYIPENFAREVRITANQHNWIETSDNADISIDTIENNNTNSESLEYIQILVLTKKWSQLTNDTMIEISNMSDHIDIETAKRLLKGSDFTLSNDTTESDNNKLSLRTIHEVNASHIPIDINGQNPFAQSTWENTTYPLILTIQISGDPDMQEIISSHMINSEFLDKNDYLTEIPLPENFVNIIKTGTTVAGGPGWTLCERVKGRNDYPIDDIKDLLTSANITIISNESSFIGGCTQEAGTTVFCGKPEYLQNLIRLGTDIISLTGNHMCDYGRTIFEETLDMYEENGINYFGAGRNIIEAWRPLLIDTEAGKLAFIGFNKMGPDGVIATESLSGTAYYDKALLTTAINQSKTAGADIIWIDTHLWPEYDTQTSNEQLSLTRECVDLEADIITGVSSHEIQGMELYNEIPIFWGLGNFLFDQMWSIETRQGLILQITLYDQKIRLIKVIPTIMHDYCQPRMAVEDTKKDILKYFESISDL